MKVTILASGSSGNCLHIQSGSAGVLVDAGKWKRDIEKRLLDKGIPATDIQAICVSHAHSDHIRGLTIANKYSIPVYASEGEWKDIDMVQDELRHLAIDGIHFTVHNGDDWLDITPFKVHHDAYEPLGYSILGSDETKVSVCLDTGKVDDEMLEAMADSDVYIIESNHDVSMVDVSNYPASVKARVLSDLGHLSNEQCADALAKLVQGKGEKIFLTHLSSSNNADFLAEATVVTALRRKGFEPGKHFFVEVV